MKKLKTLTVLTLILLIGSSTLFHSCKKKVMGCTDPSSLTYNSAATDDDGSCQYKGSATFWIDVFVGGSSTYTNNLTVTMSDGTTGIITTVVASAPSCGAAGCFTYTAKPGTYSFVAQGDSTGEWAAAGTTLPPPSYHGTITITSKGCLAEHLL